MQSGDYAGAINYLKNSNLLSDKQKASMGKLTDNLELVQGALDGNPKVIVNYLGDNTDILNDLSNNQKDALTGVLGMGLNGNFSVQRVATYGCKYFGFEGVKIGDWGVISPATLVNGFSNPMSIVSSLASQYLTNALSGAFGTGVLANFATGLVAGIAISLVLSLLGGQGRVEYHFTACGFYPGFNEKTGLVENKDGMSKEKKETAGSSSLVGLASGGGSTEILQLDAVNQAKQKALESDKGNNTDASADAWGSFVELRNKYDTIPTDEIDEDNEATRDETYTQAALDNENTQKVEAENLSSVVSWAKSKDNEAVKCYDMGQNGVFINDEAKLTTDQQKEIAKYKIKVLLGNLLKMGENTRASQTNNYLNITDIPAQAFYESPTNIYENVIGFIRENNIFSVAKAKAESGDAALSEENSKYKRILNFNFSDQNLRPTQIYTFGGDSCYPGLISSNATFSDIMSSSNVGVPADTSQYMAKTTNPFYQEIAYVIRSVTSKAQAADEPFSVENTDYANNDVSHFYVLRDKLWGDNNGSPGSQDIQLANGMYRQGMGYFKRMWDRIHFGY